MTTFLVLVLVLAVAIYFLNRKVMEAPAPLLKATKKVEETVVKAVDVNGDGKVDLADAVAAVKAVKATGKKAVKSAKKITSTKKKTK
jgi:membrane protein implicated in regulation of membrane protease activity